MHAHLSGTLHNVTHDLLQIDKQVMQVVFVHMRNWPPI
jgi:hypothetical protein